MFLVLLIASILSGSIPMMVKLFSIQGDYDRREQQIVWEVFLVQLKYDVKASYSIESYGGRVVLYEQKNVASYMSIGDELRRNGGFRGYEPCLYKVKNVDFKLYPNSFKILMKDKKNRLYESEIFSTVIDSS